MERGRRSVLEDGLGRDLMDAGRFCFSCEQIFANRRSLETHSCSAASHICSCGTEFVEYEHMLDHSTTHEPGHQVLDHGTIKKRRIEKRLEEEEQLNRLQTGQVVWNAPSTYLQPNSPLTSAAVKSMQIPQVPQLQHSVSHTSLPTKPNKKDMQNIFAGVGSPTVDLWTLYQPVVLVPTMRKFNKTQPYICAKCGQCFTTRSSLISHHSSHVTDKVAGCIGCGLLLSSKKLVPRFHVCKAPNTLTTKFRIITAKPLGSKMANVACTDRSPAVAEPLQAAPYLQLKSQNPSAASKGSRSPLIPSTLQLENQKISTYNRNKHRLNVFQSMQGRGQKLDASKSYITAPLPSMSHSPNPSSLNKSSNGFAPSAQFRRPTQSASGKSGKPMQTSSASSRFPCRVCHLLFETAHLLQRHKCAKAHEFMAKQVRVGKGHYRLKGVASAAKMNGERKLGVPVSGNFRKNKVAVGLDKVQGAGSLSGKTGGNMDDDCYIVESGPDKSAEMIYQVTSSVPIKT
ncbi:uncharacterized protein LOC119197473 [Pungitius pungitius]|uniref:uncharacterized protein LOC119197473 n=1 Tax=Pungitius pungitius TaxID=134920 RepID=UPI002E0D103D